MIAHARVCVLARLRHELYFDGASGARNQVPLGLAAPRDLDMMVPARRDIGCFGGRVPLGFPPCRPLPDRSRACVRIGAAQLELDFDGASVALHQLL